MRTRSGSCPPDHRPQNTRKDAKVELLMSQYRHSLIRTLSRLFACFAGPFLLTSHFSLLTPLSAAEPLHFPSIPPTPPEAAESTFETLHGFKMQLIAAEPLVTDPVAITYDEDGRAYVCEMNDYPYTDKDAAQGQPGKPHRPGHRQSAPAHGHRWRRRLRQGHHLRRRPLLAHRCGVLERRHLRHRHARRLVSEGHRMATAWPMCGRRSSPASRSSTCRP